MIFSSLHVNRAYLLSVIAVVTLGGCTKSKPISEPTSPSADIFSDRPINAVPDLFVVTLKSTALLKAAERTASGYKIPAAAKDALLTEQFDFEKKLKSIAPTASVIYRYHYAINGLAIYAPADMVGKIKALPEVQKISAALKFERPQQLNPQAAPLQSQGQVNSVNFIGADKAHQKGLTGRGMRVGIIDTGIDYTHSMLGGSGRAEDYKSINPNQSSSLFPNRKIVGGKDFVGTEFNSSSPLEANRLPKPDDNPIDEAGHGTHVAGTVAGVGDGKHSYSGVAPEADLYAIKVFGKDGSTMDAAIIAGLDYAADPNGDFNLDDQLNVVNLSLGGGFGTPQILYSEAVTNLARTGMIVVASAGNSGPVDYIVGAPSTSNDAFSIAASVDGSPHNWRASAVRLMSPNNPNWLVKATEGPVSKPISECGAIEGELFDIGLADQDLSEDVQKQLHGKVALIVRGKVSFEEKLKRAHKAGAIGAIVYNNERGKPFAMGGEGKVDFPAIMVSQAVGTRILDEMKEGPVRIQFKTDRKIEEPELIDQITDFSSKGPRTEDNLIKPEIAAPGKSIISAAMGKGSEAVQMDGTSMSAPHMSGAMALLRQKFPEMSPLELKAIAMKTAKVLSNQGSPVAISLQGAGRIQVDRAIEARALSEPPALSLGRIQVGSPRQEARTLRIRNLTAQTLSLSVTTEARNGLSLVAPATISLNANGTVEVPVTAIVNLQNTDRFAAELDGRIYFKMGEEIVLQVPVLAVRTQASEVSAQAAGSDLKLTNKSPVPGLAMAFNLLSEDSRKAKPEAHESWKSRSCDLQSVGYRIIKKKDEDAVQFAFKLYTPVTTWHLCEVSVLIDSNGDENAEQELAGIPAGSVSGVQTVFSSVLFDAVKAREIRAEYEQNLAKGVNKAPNYGLAVLKASPMTPFEQSTLAVIEAPLSSLKTGQDGQLHVKVATIGSGSEIESDDYLGSQAGQWFTVPTRSDAQPFVFTDEVMTVSEKEKATPIQRGQGHGKMVMYYPFNPLKENGDDQSQIFEF